MPGARQFSSRPLAEFAGQGSISTGQVALLAKHVFLGSAQFTYKGESEQEGRQAYLFTYDIPADSSSYRVRSGTAESVVAFQGSFWVDASTADLLRLEVQAYDIPEKLGLAEVNTTLNYSRVQVDQSEVLLPVTASLQVNAFGAGETLNRSRLTGCQHYPDRLGYNIHERSRGDR